VLARIVLTAAGVEVEDAKVNRESNLSSDAVISGALFCNREVVRRMLALPSNRLALCYIIINLIKRPV
jgi:hypothetical protein